MAKKGLQSWFVYKVSRYLKVKKKQGFVNRRCKDVSFVNVNVLSSITAL